MLDPVEGRRRVQVGDGPVGMAAGHGAAWVTNPGERPRHRDDRRGTPPARRGHRKDGVWVTNSLDDSVSRIDPATNRVAETIRVGAGPTAVAVGGGAVRVANNHGGTLTRIAR